MHKKNGKAKPLKAKHFIYDLVVDTNIKKQPDLEVVLTTYVKGIGNKGDIVALRPNQAYNKLLLPGLAVYKNPKNMEKYKIQESSGEERKHSSPTAQRCVDIIERMILKVNMNRHNPWVIEPLHILVSLRMAGINIKDNDESCIELPKQPINGPDLNKQNKEFISIITINQCEKARLRCRINHYSSNPEERIEFSYKEPGESLDELSSQPSGSAPTEKTN